MSSSKFVEDQRNSFIDELNNWLMTDEISKDQYPAEPQAGANALLLGTLDNHAIFPSVYTPIHQNQSAPLEADPLKFGRVTNYAMKHGSGNVQLPHQWDQTEGASNMVNSFMSHQMNLCPSVKPGRSQPSNISGIGMEKILRKRDYDKKHREKKEKTRKDNEEKLAEVIAENKRVRKENASLQEGQAVVKRDLEKCNEKAIALEREVSRLNNQLKSQNTCMEVLSDKLVASSEATNLLEQNEQLKRKIERLMTELENPDSMKIVELHEENEKLRSKAKILQLTNEALLCKMNNDEK